MTTCNPSIAFPNCSLMEIIYVQAEGVAATDRPDRDIIIHNKFLHPFRYDTQNLHQIRR